MAPVRADAKYTKRNDDLFGAGEGSSQVRGGDLATAGQLQVLHTAGVPDSKLRRLRYDRETAGKLAQMIMARRKQGLATYKQCDFLLRQGYRREEYRHMTIKQATELIGRVRANGYRKVQI